MPSPVLKKLRSRQILLFHAAYLMEMHIGHSPNELCCTQVLESIDRAKNPKILAIAKAVKLLLNNESPCDLVGAIALQLRSIEQTDKAGCSH
jgi:hypothetical protein